MLTSSLAEDTAKLDMTENIFIDSEIVQYNPLSPPYWEEHNMLMEPQVSDMTAVTPSILDSCCSKYCHNNQIEY